MYDLPTVTAWREGSTRNRTHYFVALIMLASMLAVLVVASIQPKVHFQQIPSDDPNFNSYVLVND